MVMPRTKKVKIPEFCRLMVEQGITRPTDIKIEYQTKYPNKKPRSLDAYTKALKRAGLTKEVRELKAVDVVRKAEGRHILDYKEIAEYELQSKISHIQLLQVGRLKKAIVDVWELMERTDPHTWDFTSLINGIAKKYPFAINEQGQQVFKKRSMVMLLLSAVNTIFPNILKKGWSHAFTREAGELKDFLTFAEFDLFISNVAETEMLSLEGWRALYKTQVNLGCREGIMGFNGILGLNWEDIDYTAKRCSLHEKGGRGNAGRIWKNLPLDMFPWLDGFNDLMLYHVKKYGYEPSNDRHESGRVFPVRYKTYQNHFNDTRKKCKGRIAGNKETLRPHILRKTHAQWLVKLWVPLQDICGQFPDGYFGVGWDNPQILLKYYVTLESEAREKAYNQANERMIKLGVVKGKIAKDPREQRIEELTKQVLTLTAKLTEYMEKPLQQVKQPNHKRSRG